MHASSCPVDLTSALRTRYGFHELYIADLDGLSGRPPDLGLIARLKSDGWFLWVDAGVRGVSDLRPLLDAGVDRVLMALETLEGPHALAGVVETSPDDRLAFSLDLRLGRPVVRPGAAWADWSPTEIARAALETGIDRIVVLDLARIGLGRGLGTLDLIRDLRTMAPDAELIAGGGLSHPSELAELNDVGAAAVLVGSLLHEGRWPTKSGGSG